MARKILLADDSVTAQNMGRKILADAGYDVLTVNNGSAALKKIPESRPDLVILDVYMPGYSGLEVCQRLKESEDSSRIPVLLSVGKLEPFKPEEAQRVRADGYIVKPFEASELLTALSKLEDKIVPQPEPAQPSRFARAIAAAEASSRNSETSNASKESPMQEDGWKNRIGPFHDKAEPEQPAGGLSAHHQANRLPPAALATPAEIGAEPSPENRLPRLEAEGSVDVAAVVPPGLPQDVTPEEVAAIAAASAQIKLAAAAFTAAFTGEPQGNYQSPTSPTQTGVAISAEPEVPGFSFSSSPVGTEAQEPLTMAAAAATEAKSGSARWTAVPVPLEEEAEGVSLEHEMRGSYSAFVSEEASDAPRAVAESTLAQGSAIADSAHDGSGSTDFSTTDFSTTDLSTTEPGSNVPSTSEVAESVQAFAVVREAEVPEESETAKTTAAAWASWRQVREADEASGSPALPTRGAGEAAAMAVAAGAEHPPHEHALHEAAIASPESLSDIASIVDTMLADLRPKLVAEISRKMAEKK